MFAKKLSGGRGVEKGKAPPPQQDQLTPAGTDPVEGKRRSS